MLTPEAGQIAITPQTIKIFPQDAYSALISPDMQRTVPHDISDRPALAWLDVTSNCQRNSAAIAQAAANIPSSSAVRHMSIIVGAPGIAGFYLPQDICEPLHDLATKAATAALCRNILGKEFVRMRLSTDCRPVFSTDWHCDDFPNIMLCADKVGTMFLLTGGCMEDRHLQTGESYEIMQALPGMPVSFNKIVHTTPFLDEPPNYKKHGVSSTVIFECYPAAVNPSQERVSSHNIADVVRSITGKSPKPMSYGLLS